jgi:hypothetical protein
MRAAAGINPPVRQIPWRFSAPAKLTFFGYYPAVTIEHTS